MPQCTHASRAQWPDLCTLPTWSPAPTVVPATGAPTTGSRLLRSPSGWVIVTTPRSTTVPLKLTTPAVGDLTTSPTPAARSTPRCPLDQRWAGASNRRTTAPTTGARQGPGVVTGGAPPACPDGCGSDAAKVAARATPIAADAADLARERMAQPCADDAGCGGLGPSVLWTTPASRPLEVSAPTVCRVPARSVACRTARR